MGPFEAEMLRKIIRETYGTTANYEFILQDVTQEQANDINTLIASLIQSDKQARENSSGATLEETKPFVLDQAVETAMNYMAPLANELRLRTLIRVPVADASKTQTAFRVESLRANSASEGNETNARFSRGSGGERSRAARARPLARAHLARRASSSADHAALALRGTPASTSS